MEVKPSHEWWGVGAVLVLEGRQLEVHGCPTIIRQHTVVVAITCQGAAAIAAVLHCRCHHCVAIALSIAVHHSCRCVAIAR